MNVQPRIRPAAVAGAFYPGSSSQLRREVSTLLAGVAEIPKPPPKAIIAPHAGYIYSGIVAASAFVKAGAEIPPRSLVAGMPAKIVRPLSDEEIAWKADGTRTYQELTRRCLATLVETTPLTAIEPDRKRIEMPDVIPLTELKKRGA